MHNEEHELVNLAAFDISFYVPFMYLEFYYASLPSLIPDHATLLLRPPLSVAVYGLPMRWGGGGAGGKETLSSFITGSTSSYHHNLLTGPKSPESDFHRVLVSLCNSYHLDPAWWSD